MAKIYSKTEVLEAFPEFFQNRIWERRLDQMTIEGLVKMAEDEREHRKRRYYTRDTIHICAVLFYLKSIGIGSAALRSVAHCLNNPRDHSPGEPFEQFWARAKRGEPATLVICFVPRCGLEPEDSPQAWVDWNKDVVIDPPYARLDIDLVELFSALRLPAESAASGFDSLVTGRVAVTAQADRLSGTAKVSPQSVDTEECGEAAD